MRGNYGKLKKTPQGSLGRLNLGRQKALSGLEITIRFWKTMSRLMR
jgi:hypothetical protein